MSLYIIPYKSRRFVYIMVTTQDWCAIIASVSRSVQNKVRVTRLCWVIPTLFVFLYQPLCWRFQRLYITSSPQLRKPAVVNHAQSLPPAANVATAGPGTAG